MFDLQHWRPRHLLASWVAYWIALVAVTLGPAVPAIIRATSQTGNQGSIGAGFGDDVWKLTVDVAGKTIWQGVASFTTIALWVGLPPLAIWLAWLYTRPKTPPALDHRDPSLLGAPPMDPPGARKDHLNDYERRR